MIVKRSVRGLALLLLFGCVGILLSSCLSIGPTYPYRAKDFVGTWVHNGPRGHVATLTLEADGTFTVKDVPWSVFAIGGYSPVNWNDTVDLAGNWSHRGGSARIDIEVVFIGNVGTSMGAVGQGPQMTLVALVGSDPDTDVPFVFRRLTS
jgi:hypothetical protein